MITSISRYISRVDGRPICDMIGTPDLRLITTAILDSAYNCTSYIAKYHSLCMYDISMTNALYVCL